MNGKAPREPILIGNLKPAPEPKKDIPADFDFDRLVLAPSMMLVKKPESKSKNNLIVVNKELDVDSGLFEIIALGKESAEYTGLNVGDQVALFEGNYKGVPLYKNGVEGVYVFIYATSMFYGIKKGEAIDALKVEDTSKTIVDPNVQSPLLDHVATEDGIR